MRSVFNKTLLELAAKDERIYLILADIGFGEIEPFCTSFPERSFNVPFCTSFPERSFNVGICEQNMTGIAAGIALNGNIVFTYSIANFPTFRCFEQIRNDVCYHNANVKIITIGGGVAYGPLGTSHQSTEDLSVMRALPNMVVIAPGDLIEAELLTKAMVEWDGPCYMRCGYKGEPALHSEYPDLKIGKALTIREGSDITLIATGEMLPTAVEISDSYKKEGLGVRVISMHTIKPIDAEAIIKSAEETKKIITLEENNIIGGLGGAVSEVISENVKIPIKFKRIGIKDVYPSKVGYREYLRKYYGFSEEDIRKVIGEWFV